MKRYRYAWVPALVILSQALCVWIFLRGLLDFHAHAWYIQALNSLGLPLCLANIYRMGRTLVEIHKDNRQHEATLARWRLMRERGRYIKGPEELAAYIREIEELDPAFAADLRENLQEFLPK